jgi:DNA ligase-1
MKLKAEESADVRIIGAYLGERGKQFEHTLGGLIVDFEGAVVHVGGGFSVRRDGKSRDEFLELVSEDCAQLGLKFDSTARDVRADVDAPMKVFGRTVEVLYHEITPDGSLRHPRYSRFRDDKVSA